MQQFTYAPFGHPIYNPDNPLVVCDTPQEAQALGYRLRLRTITFEEAARQPLAGSVLVVSASDAIGKARTIAAAGPGESLVRQIDTTEMQLPPLIQMIEHQQDLLRWRIANPGDTRWDSVRWLADWGDGPDMEVIQPNDPVLNSYFGWRMPGVSVIVGGWGSGKSTFAQLLMMKALASDHCTERGIAASLCCFEDLRSDFNRRAYDYALGGARHLATDATPASSITSRVKWIDPIADSARGIERYIADVEFLTANYGCRLHLFDPWSGHDAEMDYGEREHTYVRRIMSRFRDVARRLNIHICTVVHLPKSAMPEDGGIKPFRVTQASGSGDFANRADTGLCVARTSHLANILKGDVTDSSIGTQLLDQAQEASSRQNWNVDHDRDEFGLPTKVRTIRDAAGNVLETGDQHMIVSVDKIKVEEGEMGRKGVLAFTLNRQRNDIFLDAGATLLLRRLWRV